MELKNKSIVIASRKGGVGKTPLALSLAIDLDYFLITNDMGIATTVYKNKSRYLEKPVSIKNTVYDFGGFISPGVIEVVKESDLVIIPVINEDDAFVKTFLTIAELKDHAKEIILVATRTENNKDFDEIQKIIKSKLPDIKLFELSKSTVFKYVTRNGISVSQKADSTPLAKYGYRKIVDQYNMLLDYIKGV